LKKNLEDDPAQTHPIQRGKHPSRMTATEATYLATHRPNYILLMGGGYMSNVVEIQGRKYVLVPLETITPAPTLRIQQRKKKAGRANPK